MFRKKRSNLTFYQKKKTISPKVIREIFSWIGVTIVAIIVAFAFVLCFGMQVKVIGDSMEPTAYNGQTVLINKVIFKIFGPSKDDVVVFLPNGNANSHFYVKRVVAVPGDKVQIIDGKLYINGEVAAEDEAKYDKMEDAGIAANEIKLGSGEYFVLGDNRNYSFDSREEAVGNINRKDIIGRTWLRVYPFSDFGIIDK